MEQEDPYPIGDVYSHSFQTVPLHEKELTPVQKLARYILLDACQNILNPAQGEEYKRLKKDSEQFMQDKAAREFWYKIWKDEEGT